ncbi:MAG: DUF4160 domain-containing protein [Actinobacteria bacterium]|nr:DUF4160 domain-containing protein [Actinomycetota bacterium]MBI3685844.1 DUF4160 domain-containing protein [Actinomycetota bacterium]
MTAAAALVGAGAAVRAGFKAVKAASKAGRIATGGRRAARACNSFTPDTPVVMADGSTQPIDQITVGDLVATVDTGTGALIAQPVLDVITGYGTKHLLDVTTQPINPDGTPVGDPATFTATADHPIWVEGHGWTHTDHLTPGMRTRGATGGLDIIRLVHDRGWLSGHTVYNLTTANTHTYLIAPTDTTTTLVHNASGACGVGEIVRERGVRIRIYPNDHAPVHAHVSGGGRTTTRIGQNGKPLRGSRELTETQRRVVKANIRTIRKAIRREMKRYRNMI